MGIFDLFPNLLSSLISIVLPIHFTHKALRTSSPPYLAPWLMYWSILSLFLLFESYMPLLGYLPLYSTARLFFLTWLVLPQTQGATYLYQSYVGPYLVEYESKIDATISDTHRRVKAAGGDLFVKAVEWLQETILGQKPVRQEQAPGENYTQGLLRRFSIPVPGFPAPAAQGSDLSGLLASFTNTIGLNTPSTHTRDAQIQALTSNANLVPNTLKTIADRASFVAQQREKLRVLMGALDREALDLDAQRELEHRVGSGPGGLSKSRSEVSMVEVERPSSSDHHDDSSGKNKATGAAKGSGWLGGWWPAAGEKVNDGSVKAPDNSKEHENSRGISSGIDT